jgi:hypothetical protein
VVQRSVDPEPLSATAAAATPLALGRDLARRRAGLAQWAVPLAVAACAIAVALPGTVEHALYGDEVASARIVREPGVADVLRDVRKTESTPPAWYLVAWGVGKVTSADVQSLRLLSVLFAAAAAALTAIWALRLLGSRPPAALAGSLVALGSVPAEYAEQLRAYALVVLLSVAFGLLHGGGGAATRAPVARRARRRDDTRWADALLLPVRPRRRRRVAVGRAPSAPRRRPDDPRDRRRNGRVPPLAAGLPGTTGARPLRLDRAIRPGRGSQAPRRALLRAGRLRLRPRAARGHRRADRRGDRPLVAREEGSVVAALALLPILGAGALWAAGQPIFNERNMLPVAPFLAILVAAGVKALPARLVPVAAATGIVVAVGGAAYA